MHCRAELQNAPLAPTCAKANALEDTLSRSIFPYGIVGPRPDALVDSPETTVARIVRKAVAWLEGHVLIGHAEGKRGRQRSILCDACALAFRETRLASKAIGNFPSMTRTQGRTYISKELRMTSGLSEIS